MKKSALLLALCAASTTSDAWDPIGDITHPERIFRNVGRELDNAGREVDRIRIEAQAQAGAPAFEQWLIQSRNTAASGGVSGIPPNIRQQLQGFYDDDILNRARFKIGDGGIFNLSNLSIQYGGARAVTLIDVIVFQDQNGAFNDAALWAHELKHVQQFRDWGVKDFAIRYLRSWNGVEGEAYAAENSFISRPTTVSQNNNGGIPAPPVFIPQPQPASICATGIGACGMMVAIPVGAQCYCQTFNGPIWGVAR